MYSAVIGGYLLPNMKILELTSPKMIMNCFQRRNVQLISIKFFHDLQILAIFTVEFLIRRISLLPMIVKIGPLILEIHHDGLLLTRQRP